jgi:hypothetical protein
VLTVRVAVGADENESSLVSCFVMAALLRLLFHGNPPMAQPLQASIRKVGLRQTADWFLAPMADSFSSGKRPPSVSLTKQIQSHGRLTRIPSLQAYPFAALYLTNGSLPLTYAEAFEHYPEESYKGTQLTWCLGRYLLPLSAGKRGKTSDSRKKLLAQYEDPDYLTGSVHQLQAQANIYAGGFLLKAGVTSTATAQKGYEAAHAVTQAWEARRVAIDKAADQRAEAAGAAAVEQAAKGAQQVLTERQAAEAESDAQRAQVIWTERLKVDADRAQAERNTVARSGGESNATGAQFTGHGTSRQPTDHHVETLWSTIQRYINANDLRAVYDKGVTLDTLSRSELGEIAGYLRLALMTFGSARQCANCLAPAEGLGRCMVVRTTANQHQLPGSRLSPRILPLGPLGTLGPTRAEGSRNWPHGPAHRRHCSQVAQEGDGGLQKYISTPACLSRHRSFRARNTVQFRGNPQYAW